MGEAPGSHSYVCVRVEYVDVIRGKLKEIRETFRVSLREVPPPQAKAQLDGGAGTQAPSVMFFTVEKSGEAPQAEVSQIAGRVQCFVDALCAGLGDHGDDSSYDSDAEGEGDYGDLGDGHQDVSRTTSETLAAEYADYVTQGDAAVSRLEFGLRLGYTEPLVRAALRRLGPSPAQNELLAELIRQAAKAPRRAPAPGAAPGPAAAPAPATPGVAREPEDAAARPRLRPIVIDGSNVAMSHGNKEVFSCRGLRLCVDWFRARGHTDITVFVPKWRKEAPRPDNLVTEQSILGDLERERLLVYTPSRLVAGKRLVCYDDRYVLRLAADTGGVVVSNDNYRDLAQENADFRRVIEERILMYSFVNDRFMPPEDPLGRAGPSLDQFLQLPSARADQAPPCPYAKKCTYGNKCKFSHPERGALPHKSVTERLAEQAQRQLQAAGLRAQGHGKPLKGKSLSLPLDADQGDKQAVAAVRKAPLTRSQSGVPRSMSMDVSRPVTGPGGGAAAAAASAASAGADAAAANLHRPLQRQLSLNPTFDPRLLQMRRAIGADCGGGALPAALTGTPLTSPLTGPLQAAAHPGVTRIASDPCRPGAGGQPWAQPQARRMVSVAAAGPAHQPAHQPATVSAMGSCGSEPQLSRLSGYEWSQALYNHQAQQVRQRLHYHLASIFPEDLVSTAMALYPDEVDPQKICAAILALQQQHAEPQQAS